MNWLIDNGILDPTSTNVNGWIKITYGQAVQLLDKLAAAMESALPSGSPVVGSYGLPGTPDESLLCNNIDSAPYGNLLNSFAGAVGGFEVKSAAVYGPGLNGNVFCGSKTYDADVTINCADGAFNQFRFAGCTFNGNLIINGGTGSEADEILLNFCTINGNIIVKDNDGKTSVAFHNVEFTHPDTSTVAVSEKTPGGAQDSARFGDLCNSVRLTDLPSGIRIIDDAVSVIVYLNSQGTATINGVTMTAGAPSGSSYYALMKACWMNPTSGPDIPYIGRVRRDGKG